MEASDGSDNEEPQLPKPCSVKLAAYIGKFTSRGWVDQIANMVIGKLVKKFSHAEFVFEFNDEGRSKFYSCVIYRGCCIELAQKMYDKVGWLIYDIHVDQDVLNKLFASCINDIKNHVPYNYFVFWNVLCYFDALKIDMDGTRVYCSEHCARKLQECKVPGFEDCKPWDMDVDTLVNLLKEGVGEPSLALMDMRESVMNV